MAKRTVITAESRVALVGGVAISAGTDTAAEAGPRAEPVRVLSGRLGKLAVHGAEAGLVDVLKTRPTVQELLLAAQAQGVGALQTLSLVRTLHSGGWLADGKKPAQAQTLWRGPLLVLLVTWVVAAGLLLPLTPAGAVVALTQAAGLAAGLTVLWATAPWLSKPGEWLALRLLGVHQARARSWAWMRRRLWQSAVRRRALDPVERGYIALGTWNIAHLLAVVLFCGALIGGRAQAWAYGPGVATAWLAPALARLILLGLLSMLAMLPALVLAWMGATSLGQWLPRRATPPLRSSPVDAATAQRLAAELALLPIFASIDAAWLAELAAAAVCEDHGDGAAVLRQGEPGDRLCWLAAGTVRVQVEDEAGLTYDVATLGPGALFGETALLEAVPRTATVLADGHVQVVTLAREAFARLIASQVASASEVREHIRTAAALRSHPLFQALDAAGLRGLLTAAEVLRLGEGHDVVTQGEAGEHLYVLREGAVRVQRSSPRGPRNLASLQAGDWFGELALLGTATRTATVTTTMPSVLVRLHRDAVDAALVRDVTGALLLLEAAAERLDRLKAGEVA